MDDGGDNDYTWSDNAPEDECEEEDQDEESETDLGDGVLRIRVSKKGGSKRDRFDSLHLQGMQGLEKKKSKQDLCAKVAHSERIRLDLTTSHANHLAVPLPDNNNLPALSIFRPMVNTPSAVSLKAIEAQIPYVDRRILDLAKPILASMVYLSIPWPTGIQAQAALCDEAWQQAINVQSVQLRAVGATKAYEHMATVESNPASWTMENITRGIVSFLGMF